jgi:hypothetical protein
VVRFSDIPKFWNVLPVHGVETQKKIIIYHLMRELVSVEGRGENKMHTVYKVLNLAF